ncbi:Periplasmic [NiFeSe] hydrogenase small subunit [subsurface metagenome]
MAHKTKELPVIWIQGSGCSGCSVSVLNALSPSITNALIDEIVPGSHISLLFHPTLMAGSGEPAISAITATEKEHKEGYILVIEGAVATGNNGAFAGVGEYEGKHLTMAELTSELASKCLALIALGSCACFGGIPGGEPNPTGILGIQEFLESKSIKKPLINIPGCPSHPDWFLGTVAHVILNGLPGPQDLDDLNRPKLFFGKLIHENCQRRAYFDAGKFAERFGDEGCLYKLGCKGPYTYADCPIRKWNSGVNWCVDNGSPCIGCCEPEFPDKFSPMYEKITQERIEQFSIREGGSK